MELNLIRTFWSVDGMRYICNIFNVVMATGEEALNVMMDVVRKHDDYEIFEVVWNQKEGYILKPKQVNFESILGINKVGDKIDVPDNPQKSIMDFL